MDREIEPGQVEWLDLGPAEPTDPTDPHRRSRRPWYLAAGAVAGAVILVAALNMGTKRQTASPTHSPRPSATDSTVPSSSAPSSASPSPSASSSVTVTNLGHRLLDVPADWELFARGTNTLVRIELARGRLTSTAVPPLDSGGGASMVVGPHSVIVRPFDAVPGYEVRDGQRSRELPAVFGAQGPALPGPDRNHLWVSSGPSNHIVMRLVGFDGRPTGVAIPIPADGQAGPNGAGYLTFYGTGGVYDARPGVVRRITGGELLAVGPTRWLTRECDEQYRCQTISTDRNTGAKRVLDFHPMGFGEVGVISPDGSYAALVRMTNESATALHVIDLATGADRPSTVGIDPTNTLGGVQLAWSPDSRWLFLVGGNARVVALDPQTMRTVDVGVTGQSIVQVVLRTGAG